MAHRFRGGRAAHVLLWSGVAIALLVVSAPKIYRGATTFSLQPGQPLHTSDRFLQFATGANDASRELMASFESVPPSKSVIIFVGKGDARSSLLGMTSAYLAWPHPVRLTEINGSNSDAEVLALNPATVAALVFCRVERPAWIKPGKLLGTTLEVVPLLPRDNQ